MASSIRGSIANGFLSLVFLNESGYTNNPHILKELLRNNKPCISKVTAETYHRVRKGVNEAISGRDGHFQRLI